MQTVYLQRENASVPWGFQLRGGIEFNTPLTVCRINKASPACSVIECDDTIQFIGRFPALNLRREEAVNIIRMFDVTLPLVVKRGQKDTNASHLQPITTSSFSVWQPPSSLGSHHDEPFNVDPNLSLSRHGSNLSLASWNASNDNKYWSEEEIEEEIQSNKHKPFEIKEIIQRFEQEKVVHKNMHESITRTFNWPENSKKPFTYMPAGNDSPISRRPPKDKRSVSSIDCDFTQSRSPTPPYTQLSPLVSRKLESKSETRADQSKSIRMESKSEYKFSQQRNDQRYASNQQFQQFHQSQQRLDQKYEQNTYQKVNHQTRHDSHGLDEQSSFYNSSRSPSPTSAQRRMPLPVKTQTSMQRATSVKSQNFEIYQNMRPTSRVYQSNIDLYQSKERLLPDYPQPHFYSRQPTPLAIITSNTVSEKVKFNQRHALPPVNSNSPVVQHLLKPVKMQQTPQQPPQSPQLQFKLRKKHEALDFSNQSQSFKLINRWIHDCEQSMPDQPPVKKETIKPVATVEVKRTDVLKAVQEEKKFIGLRPVREKLIADSKNVVLNQAEVDKKDHFNLNPTTPTFNNSKPFVPQYDLSKKLTCPKQSKSFIMLQQFQKNQGFEEKEEPIQTPKVKNLNDVNDKTNVSSNNSGFNSQFKVTHVENTLLVEEINKKTTSSVNVSAVITPSSPIKNNASLPPVSPMQSNQPQPNIAKVSSNQYNQFSVSNKQESKLQTQQTLSKSQVNIAQRNMQPKSISTPVWAPIKASENLQASAPVKEQKSTPVWTTVSSPVSVPFSAPLSPPINTPVSKPVLIEQNKVETNLDKYNSLDKSVVNSTTENSLISKREIQELISVNKLNEEKSHQHDLVTEDLIDYTEISSSLASKFNLEDQYESGLQSITTETTQANDNVEQHREEYYSETTTEQFENSQNEITNKSDDCITFTDNIDEISNFIQNQDKFENKETNCYQNNYEQNENYSSMTNSFIDEIIAETTSSVHRIHNVIDQTIQESDFEVSEVTPTASPRSASPAADAAIENQNNFINNIIEDINKTFSPDLTPTASRSSSPVLPAQIDGSNVVSSTEDKYEEQFRHEPLIEAHASQQAVETTNEVPVEEEPSPQQQVGDAQHGEAIIEEFVSSSQVVQNERSIKEGPINQIIQEEPVLPVQTNNSNVASNTEEKYEEKLSHEPLIEAHIPQQAVEEHIVAKPVFEEPTNDDPVNEKTLIKEPLIVLSVEETATEAPFVEEPSVQKQVSVEDAQHTKAITEEPIKETRTVETVVSQVEAQQVIVHVGQVAGSIKKRPANEIIKEEPVVKETSLPEPTKESNAESLIEPVLLIRPKCIGPEFIKKPDPAKTPIIDIQENSFVSAFLNESSTFSSQTIQKSLSQFNNSEEKKQTDTITVATPTKSRSASPSIKRKSLILEENASTTISQLETSNKFSKSFSPSETVTSFDNDLSSNPLSISPTLFPIASPIIYKYIVQSEAKNSRNEIGASIFSATKTSDGLSELARKKLTNSDSFSKSFSANASPISTPSPSPALLRKTDPNSTSRPNVSIAISLALSQPNTGSLPRKSRKDFSSFDSEPLRIISDVISASKTVTPAISTTSLSRECTITEHTMNKIEALSNYKTNEIKDVSKQGSASAELKAIEDQITQDINNSLTFSKKTREDETKTPKSDLASPQLSANRKEIIIPSKSIEKIDKIEQVKEALKTNTSEANVKQENPKQLNSPIQEVKLTSDLEGNNNFNIYSKEKTEEKTLEYNSLSLQSDEIISEKVVIENKEIKVETSENSEISNDSQQILSTKKEQEIKIEQAVASTEQFETSVSTRNTQTSVSKGKLEEKFNINDSQRASTSVITQTLVNLNPNSPENSLFKKKDNKPFAPVISNAEIQNINNLQTPFTSTINSTSSKFLVESKTAHVTVSDAVLEVKSNQTSALNSQVATPADHKEIKTEFSSKSSKSESVSHSVVHTKIESLTKDKKAFEIKVDKKIENLHSFSTLIKVPKTPETPTIDISVEPPKPAPKAAEPLPAITKQIEKQQQPKSVEPVEPPKSVPKAAEQLPAISKQVEKQQQSEPKKPEIKVETAKPSKIPTLVVEKPATPQIVEKPVEVKVAPPVPASKPINKPVVEPVVVKKQEVSNEKKAITKPNESDTKPKKEITLPVPEVPKPKPVELTKEDKEKLNKENERIKNRFKGFFSKKTDGLKTIPEVVVTDASASAKPQQVTKPPAPKAEAPAIIKQDEKKVTVVENSQTFVKAEDAISYHKSTESLDSVKSRRITVKTTIKCFLSERKPQTSTESDEYKIAKKEEPEPIDDEPLYKIVDPIPLHLLNKSEKKGEAPKAEPKPTNITANKPNEPIIASTKVETPSTITQKLDAKQDPLFKDLDRKDDTQIVKGAQQNNENRNTLKRQTEANKAPENSLAIALVDNGTEETIDPLYNSNAHSKRCTVL